MGVYAAIFSIGLAIVVGVYFKGRADGSESRNHEIAAYQASIAASKAAAEEALEKAAKTAATVVTEFRDRVKVIKEREPAEIQLVEVIRAQTPDSCLLPPAWRELWDGTDSRASGGPQAENPGGTDAAPVGVAEAAATAAEARRRFEQNKAQLESIQRIIANQ